MAQVTKVGTWFIRINPKDQKKQLERSGNGQSWTHLVGLPGVIALGLTSMSNGDCIIETNKGKMTKKSSGVIEKMR